MYEANAKFADFDGSIKGLSPYGNNTTFNITFQYFAIHTTAGSGYALRSIVIQFVDLIHLRKYHMPSAVQNTKSANIKRNCSIVRGVNSRNSIISRSPATCNPPLTLEYGVPLRIPITC
ncbi:hypothetical protein EVAR_73411_1 [Eumeta japonica]|uniref:Uncharacterized protein n=1 Tax=Eumeta variegata TaxID=151549 RepID=A0A4C1TK86_EUMVA|nr:hypothetical protein EVAR_73411_1 [Eumeta japonica]